MGDIELPFPAKVLWPNGRAGHWAQVRREFKKHKGWAHFATMAALGGLKPEIGERVKLAFTIYPKTRHPIDADNAVAAMKAYVDGIASAIQVNDKLFLVPSIQFAEPVKGGRIIVSIMP